MQPESSEATPPSIPHRAIDVNAAKTVRRLVQSGHKAYLVGGCVRDLLLGIQPKDFDIATDATPRRVRRLFRNSRIIGRRFRLAHVRFGQQVLEVATFRAPPDPQEGDDLYIRRDNVFGTEEQDAHRRDFTVNGLFYDLVGGRVIDHVGGVEDVRARCIRTIGDPRIRLQEDPVRILRAIKFAARLDFHLDPELEIAVREIGEDLSRSAPPRLLEEIYRMLSGKGVRRAFEMMDAFGVLRVLVPELGEPTAAFRGALDRLEEFTGGQRDAVPQWALFAVLCSPFVLPRLPDAGGDLEPLVLELIDPLARRYTVARRDSTRARQCLAGQIRLERSPEGRGARRWMRSDHFRDTLQLRKILGPLDQEGDGDPRRDAWENAWKALPPGGDRRRGRKRRRRKRRRRKPQPVLSPSAGRGTGEACPNPSASSSAPAPPPMSNDSRPNSSRSDSPPA